MRHARRWKMQRCSRQRVAGSAPKRCAPTHCAARGCRSSTACDGSDTWKRTPRSRDTAHAALAQYGTLRGTAEDSCGADRQGGALPAASHAAQARRTTCTAGAETATRPVDRPGRCLQSRRRCGEVLGGSCVRLLAGHTVACEILLELNAAIRARLGVHFLHFERVREFGVQLRPIPCRVGCDAAWDTMPRRMPHSEIAALGGAPFRAGCHACGTGCHLGCHAGWIPCRIETPAGSGS